MNLDYGCHPISRRRALVQVGGLGAFGIRLVDLLAARSNASEPSPIKSVVLLWLWGGPSHLDTFDMKPTAPLEYRGPFEPIQTKVPGLSFCELLPNLSKVADKIAIIRSMNHASNDHGVAGTIALTGSQAGAVALGGSVSTGVMRPSIGSIIGRLNPRPSGQLPGYVILGSQLHYWALHTTLSDSTMIRSTASKSLPLISQKNSPPTAWTNGLNSSKKPGPTHLSPAWPWIIITGLPIRFSRHAKHLQHLISPPNLNPCAMPMAATDSDNAACSPADSSKLASLSSR